MNERTRKAVFQVLSRSMDIMIYGERVNIEQTTREAARTRRPRDRDARGGDRSPFDQTPSPLPVPERWIAWL